MMAQRTIPIVLVALVLSGVAALIRAARHHTTWRWPWPLSFVQRLQLARN